MPEDSVIILATEGMEQLNFEEGRQIIVNTVCKISFTLVIMLQINYHFYRYNLLLIFSGIWTGIHSVYNKY